MVNDGAMLLLNVRNQERCRNCAMFFSIIITFNDGTNPFVVFCCGCTVSALLSKCGLHATYTTDIVLPLP